MKSSEFITEDDNVTKGDFGAKGGPKPQMQNAKKISMAQAFGSEAYNILADAGIKFHEKPSYWQDLESKAIGEIGQKKVENLLKQAGVGLEEYAAWEIYSIDPDSQYAHIKGPLQTVENMPDPKVFVIYDLPYKGSEGEIKVGTFLVDRQGASSYIRFWRQIK